MGVMKVDPYWAAKCTVQSKMIDTSCVDKLALMLIQDLKNKLIPDPWVGLLHIEMQALLSIERKTQTSLLEFWLQVYEEQAKGYSHFGAMFIGMDLAEKLITYFEPMVKDGTHYYQVEGWLAIALRIIGNFDDSLVHLKNCLITAPNDQWILANMGLICQEMKNTDQCAIYLRRAVEPSLEESEWAFWTHYCLGEFLQKKKDYNAALEHFKKSINFEFKYSKPHIGLAEIYCQHLKQFDKAITEYEIAIKLEQRPFRLAGPIHGIAGALEAAGRTTEARQRYQEYLDRFPWGEHAQEAQGGRWRGWGRSESG